MQLIQAPQRNSKQILTFVLSESNAELHLKNLDEDVRAQRQEDGFWPIRDSKLPLSVFPLIPTLYVHWKMPRTGHDI